MSNKTKTARLTNEEYALIQALRYSRLDPTAMIDNYKQLAGRAGENLKDLYTVKLEQTAK